MLSKFTLNYRIGYQIYLEGLSKLFLAHYTGIINSSSLMTRQDLKGSMNIEARSKDWKSQIPCFFECAFKGALNT